MRARVVSPFKSFDKLGISLPDLLALRIESACIFCPERNLRRGRWSERMIVADSDIQHALGETAEAVTDALRARTADLHGWPPRLAEAVRYSLLAGGKRLRPILTLWCCEICDGERAAAMPAAMAIECIHTFSLIHDDLPALDDDDYRRGVATSHKVFGEATALLAGDALMTLAFEIIASDLDDPEMARGMTLELASATGGAGMIGGELRDIESEAHAPDVATTEAIHAAKTARLIQSACRLGAVAAGADEERMAVVSAYGHGLGLAFQIADDLLDTTGTLETMGKRTGKDAAGGKQTMPRAVGEAESRLIAGRHVEQAVTALAPFGRTAARLAALARYAIDRNK